MTTAVVVVALLCQCRHTEERIQPLGNSIHVANTLRSPSGHIELWDRGRIVERLTAQQARRRGLTVIDLGEDWAPYVFSDGPAKAEKSQANTYRSIYLELAKSEFPNNYHGTRAKSDKYLELFGVLPTLSVMRSRLGAALAQKCDAFALLPLITYAPEHVNKKQKPSSDLVAAVQELLQCEGHLSSKYRRGALDDVTHTALELFERRHRILGFGDLSAETMSAIKVASTERARLDVLRVLTERAMLEMGTIEDGSTSLNMDGTLRTYRGTDGAQHPIPNLRVLTQARLTTTFALQSTASTRRFLESVADGSSHRYVAFEAPPTPEYYRPDMQLSVVIDRGDVWYDFSAKSRPYRESDLRPTLTIVTRYLDQDIPLATYGTTIGGWKSENISGMVYWKYKNSPMGVRAWTKIVSGPVWVPPSSTPDYELFQYGRLNRHAMGPSYASAYGLVAAHHRLVEETDDGSFRVMGDEGIRTHGSADYMSIMRRHSHGCHRLHNHVAVRVMNFALKHHPHTRTGEAPMHYQRTLEYKGRKQELRFTHAGYAFDLLRPLPINVTRGRIRGAMKHPAVASILKRRPNGAYVLSDGTLLQPEPEILDVNEAAPPPNTHVPVPAQPPVPNASTTPPIPLAVNHLGERE